MKTEMRNSWLSLVVDTLGAELKSLKKADTDLELLWQGNPQYWKDQSPLLFPVVGGLPDDRYELNGRHYTMLQHGFAQGSEFTLVEQSDESIMLQLNDNEKTYSQYPWRFSLCVQYTLKDNCLAIGYSLHNRDDKTMLFSIGAHPGFRCPIYDNETMEDYYLLFERPETISRRIKDGGLLTGERVPLLADENILPLTHSLFYNDAIIINGFNSRWVELRSNKNSQVIRVEFDGFPYLGIWSTANDAPFVCIEPWYGVDSTHGDSYDLNKKEGIQTLKSGGIFNCEYRIILSI